MCYLQFFLLRNEIADVPSYLVCLSIHIFVCCLSLPVAQFFYIPLSICLCLSACLFVSLSSCFRSAFSLCVRLSFPVCVYVCLYVCIPMFIPVSLFLYLYFFRSLKFDLSLCLLSVFVSVLSVCLCLIGYLCRYRSPSRISWRCPGVVVRVSCQSGGKVAGAEEKGKDVGVGVVVGVMKCGLLRLLG